MRTRLAAVAAALALAACSGAVNPKDLDPYADAEQACRALMDAMFSQAARCGMSRPLAESYFDAAAGRCAGLDRPTVAIDVPEFRACVERLADSPCWEDMEDVCPDLVLGGTVQAGGACTSDSDCAPGLEGCHSPDRTCGGTCRAYGGQGDACGNEQDPQCGEGFYCDESLVCSRRSGTSEPCTYTSDCADGLQCQGPYGLATCQPVHQVHCENEGQCQTSDDGTYYCPLWEASGSLSRACRRLGEVAEDAGRCTGTWSGKRCPGDQWCDTSRYACEPRTLDGPCVDHEQCLAPAFCQIIGQATEGTCQVPVKLGGGCVVGLRECELGAYCEGPTVAAAGKCVSWPGPGGTCGVMTGGELAGCVDGWCKPSDTGQEQSTCSPYSSVGATCVGSAECGNAGDLGGTDCVDGFCAKSCPL